MRLCLGCLLHASCNSEAGPGWSTNWMISWVTYWATLQSSPHFARSQQVSWVLLLVFMVSIFWLPYFVDVVSRHYGFLRWSLKIQQLQIPPLSVGAQTSNVNTHVTCKNSWYFEESLYSFLWFYLFLCK